MLVIRLQRVGKKKQASFRVVLQEQSWKPQGKIKELLGFYDPHSKDKKFQEERVKYWISQGAQPSPTVHNIFVDAGIIKGEKKQAWKPKPKAEVPSKDEEPNAKPEVPSGSEGQEKPADEEAAPEEPKAKGEAPGSDSSDASEEESGPQPEGAGEKPADDSPKEQPKPAEEKEKEESAKDKSEAKKPEEK